MHENSIQWLKTVSNGKSRQKELIFYYANQHFYVSAKGTN